MPPAPIPIARIVTAPSSAASLPHQIEQTQQLVTPTSSPLFADGHDSHAPTPLSPRLFPVYFTATPPPPPPQMPPSLYPHAPLANPYSVPPPRHTSHHQRHPHSHPISTCPPLTHLSISLPSAQTTAPLLHQRCPGEMRRLPQMIDDPPVLTGRFGVWPHLYGEDVHHYLEPRIHLPC